jgi:hypothetical protein
MPYPEPGWREHAPPRTRLLAGLTPEQARAVTHGTGPLLLIAGPAAGKTRTLTHRIAYRRETEFLHALGSFRGERCHRRKVACRTRFGRLSVAGSRCQV